HRRGTGHRGGAGGGIVSPVPGFGHVAVVGAGTMGHGIAQVAAAAGCEVVLHDADPDAAERGLQRIRANLEKGIARGKVTPDGRDRTLGRIRTAGALADAVADAELVVEAVPES